MVLNSQFFFWRHRVSLNKGSHLSLASRFNKVNPEPCDGSLSPLRAKPHKLSALRLNTWPCALREISFMVAASISSPFKWHQTGGTLFSAYKCPSVQVLHLIHRQSQTTDRPRIEFSKWFIIFFCAPFKWLASIISLRPDGFKPLLLVKKKINKKYFKPHGQTFILLCGSEMGFWWSCWYCSKLRLIFNANCIIHFGSYHSVSYTLKREKNIYFLSFTVFVTENQLF